MSSKSTRSSAVEEAPPGVATEQAPAEVQTQGNQAALEAAGLGANAPAEGGGECLDPEVQEATARLLDVADQLVDARIAGVDDAWDAIEFGSVPEQSDWRVDMLLSVIEGVVATVGAALLRPEIAAVAKLVGDGLREILEALLEEATKKAVEAGTRAAIDSALSDQQSKGLTQTEAFFVGAKTGLRADAISKHTHLRAFARRAGQLDGGARAIRELADRLMARLADAESEQLRASVVEWMNLAAQTDTGGDPGQGARLDEAGDGRGWFGRDARGVLYVYATGDVFTGEVAPYSSSLRGITEQALAAISGSGLPVRDLGVPIRVVMDVQASPMQGIDAGTVHVGLQGGRGVYLGCDGVGGLRFVEQAGGEEAAARKILQATATLSLDELAPRLEE